MLLSNLTAMVLEGNKKLFKWLSFQRHLVVLDVQRLGALKQSWMNNKTKQILLYAFQLFKLTETFAE